MAISSDIPSSSGWRRPAWERVTGLEAEEILNIPQLNLVYIYCIRINHICKW